MDLRSYRRITPFLRPHAWRMAGNIFFNLIGAALDGYSFALLIPFLNALFGLPALPIKSGWVTDFLTWTIGSLLDPNDPMRSLLHVIFILLGTVALKNLCVWIAGTLGAQLQEFITRDLRDAVYRHLQSLPIGWFTRTKVGQIISRVLSDTEQTKTLVTQLVTQAISAAAMVTIYIAYLFGISWRLTLMAIVVAPVLTFALQPLLRKLRRGYRRVRNNHGEMMSVLQESVSGIRLVKSFAAEGYEESRFISASHTYSSQLVKMAKLALISQPITETLGTCIVVLLLWVGARWVLVDRTLQASQFLVFLTFVIRMLQPLKQLSQIPAIAQNSFASAERLFEVLDMPTEKSLDKGTRTATRFDGTLAFDHVSFAYDPGTEVLDDISFTAHKGDVVALVGASGAGKSTLADLIPRFYEPTSGRILLDGVDTRDIVLPSLRALTGIVSQETVLFNDSVRANIAYGRAVKFTDAQIEAAARAANAHGFITELPEGYNTVLGERGARLSGGQRQRIAIARALLVDPPILILDEATSALDTESERLVQEAIDRLLAGRTVIVIAHRLSTIVNATEILVLDRGRIIERGTHEALLEMVGAYHRLHTLQFGDRDSQPVEEHAHPVL
ncbi:MAG TPA: ABC transporter transmembrane domain-containing protein [Gemmatimonadaceae bacterium]|nr:ABC transporter transmembrane domain-containing protein [Gemmatimonadaceae bacterium]